MASIPAPDPLGRTDGASGVPVLPGWLRDPDGSLVLGPVVLAADPSAPGTARRLLVPLDRYLPERSARDAALLLSELVTNAVRHTSSARLALVARLAPSTLRVAVTDADAHVVPRRRLRPDPAVPGGLGLRIVAGVASRWGTRLHPPAKTVWFELPVGASP